MVVNLCEAAAPADAYVCTECPEESARVFNDRRALLSHRMRCHGHRKLSRQFINSDVCPACGKSFPSMARALDHLEYRSKRCHAMMVAGELEPVPG